MPEQVPMPGFGVDATARILYDLGVAEIADQGTIVSAKRAGATG